MAETLQSVFVLLANPWFRVGLLAVITAVMAYRDPRRMRVAVFLAWTVSYAVWLLLGAVGVRLNQISDQDGAIYLLVLGAFTLLLLLGVVVFFTWTGAVLVIREGPSVPHFLSLAAGVAIAVYMAALVVTAMEESEGLFVLLALVALPLSTFSFGLFAYLQYSALYGWWAKRLAPPGNVVTVLGAGLKKDRVTPLLAKRLDLGLEMYAKSLDIYPDATLIVSGGKGGDEWISEGEAMGNYVRETGWTRGRLLQEMRSVSTEENLRFSAELLEDEGVAPPGPTTWMVVTSDFHAFRAAMLMSRMGLDGNAVGARSVTYFWTSAKLREFIAILAENRVSTVFFIVTSGLPLAAYVALRIAELF